MNTLLHSEILHFVIYIAFASLVGGMPAPTKDSSVGYQWAFKSLNMFAANFTRATSTKLEKSPNFQDAIAKLPDQPQPPQVPTSSGGD